MVKETTKYKGKATKDHHITRDNNYGPGRSGTLFAKKGGAGKGNWGVDGVEVADLPFQVGESFEDPKLSPGICTEPKIRLLEGHFASSI